MIVSVLLVSVLSPLVSIVVVSDIAGSIIPSPIVDVSAARESMSLSVFLSELQLAKANPVIASSAINFIFIRIGVFLLKVKVF